MARHTHPEPVRPARRRRTRRAQDMPTCVSSGKRRYRDKKSALQVLRTAVAAAALNPDSRRREQRAYRCPDCHGWHLTSRPTLPLRGTAAA
jgi:hypothetical protein